MTWNYRVIKDSEGYLSIHEVYYDEDGAIVSWSKDPISPSGEDFEDISSDISYMKLALLKPILLEIGEESEDSLELVEVGPHG